MTSKACSRLGLTSLCLLIPLGAASAGEPPKLTPRLPGISLPDAMREGSVPANAEGPGDGNMAISVTNHTSHKLRVMLPPGLVASGASGQMGGMGGGGMMG